MPDTMKAAVLHGTKDLRLESRTRPVLPPGFVMLRIRRAGICGSDLHYYEHGACGAFAPDRPFVLGHEFAADIAAIGEDVSGWKIGDRVTANPARACGRCDYCKGGRPNLCRHTIMLGSASTKPPTDGAFAEFVAVRADQCHLLPTGLDDGAGALLEPLAVALHAVKRAGSVSGRRVLVTGGGTIGLLTAVTSRAFGATPVVVTDVVQARRAKATALGADAALDPAGPRFGDEARALAGEGFDVILEASGARVALRQAFDLVRPGGTIVQIGTLGTEDVPLPANQIMAREITLVGSMRYGNVFDEAIRLVASGRIDLSPFLSDVLPFADCRRAMELAGERTSVLKVQLQLG
jgi:L-idonate 5-dehydrogenase